MKITVEQVRKWPRSKKLFALTAYDYPTARILDEAGVHILHVGDSLGMVVLGYPDTTSVTMDDMLRATAAVARARKNALITADMPIHSYNTPELAVQNAKKLIAAGADAVKLEGGSEILPQIQAVRKVGVEVQGHIGMLPQNILQEGGYKRKGKTEEEIQRLKNDALALEKAGVFSIVLEVIVSEVAAEITNTLSIPTLGIASGTGTAGQIRVIHDLVGFSPWFTPAHAKPFVQIHEHITQAVKEFFGKELSPQNR